MSLAHMQRAWDSGLPTTRRLVLLCLADHANERGECFVLVATLCRRTGLGERAVQGAIQALVKAGWLETRRRAARCSTYRISDAVPAPAAGATRTACGEDPHEVRREPAPAAPITVPEPCSEPNGNRRAGAPATPLPPVSRPSPGPSPSVSMPDPVAPPVPVPAPVTPTPAGALSRALRAAGMRCWPDHPDVRALAGEDHAALLALYADLRAEKPGEALNPAYLHRAWASRKAREARGAVAGGPGAFPPGPRRPEPPPVLDTFDARPDPALLARIDRANRQAIEDSQRRAEQAHAEQRAHGGKSARERALERARVAREGASGVVPVSVATPASTQDPDVSPTSMSTPGGDRGR